jgi:hypothetical protein
LDVVEEFNKENDGRVDDARATKKHKGPLHDGPKMPASKLPRHRDRRTGSLTPARLNLLATPKRRYG